MHMSHTGTIFTIALLSALYHEIKPELFFLKTVTMSRDKIDYKSNFLC